MAQSIYGLYSSRPELGTSSSSVLLEFEDREWKKNVIAKLNTSKDAIMKEFTFADSLLKSGYASSATPFLFTIEKAFLDISLPPVTAGSFYLSIFLASGQLYCRYFESGIFSGYFYTDGLSKLRSDLTQHYPQSLVENIFYCQVFNETDLEWHQKRYTDQLKVKREAKQITKASSEVGRRYKNLLLDNKTSIVQSHRKLMAKAQSDNASICKLLGTVVLTVKTNSHKDVAGSNSRFMDCSGILHNYFSTWESSTQSFRCRSHSHIVSSNWEVLKTPLENTNLNWDQKCQLLNIIPNYHYWKEGFPSHVGISQMLSVTDLTGRYKPVSPRNAILFSFRYGDFGAVYKIFKTLMKPTESGESIDMQTPPDVDLQTVKRRKTNGNSTTHRTTALTEDDILRNIRIIDPKFTTSNRATDVTSYTYYKLALLENGSVSWRFHDEHLDVFVLNDINIDNGVFMPFSYVHMTRLFISETAAFSCTCHLFGTLMQIASLDISQQDIVSVDSVEIKCCHIRFFQEYVEPHLTLLLESAEGTDVIPLIRNSTKNLNQPLCELPSSHNTRKFSVLSTESTDCNFVHLVDNRLHCQSGHCNVLFSSSKRLVKYLEMSTSLCPHLTAMKQNKDLWILDNMVTDENVGDDDGDDEDDLYENVEDPEAFQIQLTSRNDIKDNFDTNTGLWDFKSLSYHKPKPDGDPDLQAAIQKRQRIFDGADNVSRNSNGYLTSSDLCQLFPTLDVENCQCGAGYYSAEFPEGCLSEVKSSPCIYTNNGPVIYTVQDRMCLGRTPECTVEYYNVSTECIHFLSKETGAGDELGYEFIDHAMNSHISFSAFCTMKNLQYKRFYSKSANFMSVQTFLSWWFSWSCKMRIDFRQPCYICKNDPKFLACDGTKIGITFKHAKVTPIETPDSDEVVEPCHRRNQRSFLHFNIGTNGHNVIKCRKHLLYLANKFLGLLKTNEVLPYNIQHEADMLLLETVDADCMDILRRFICNEYPCNIQKQLAYLFKSLSTSHSLSGIIPFRYVNVLQNVVNRLLSGNEDYVNELSAFSPEIQGLVSFSLRLPGVKRDVALFLQYLVKRVKSIKDSSKAPSPPVPIPGSYNPEKYGRAYYFTPTGEQLRHMPIYSMNDQAHSNNYDDPLTEHEEKCHKLYPQVSRKGTTYLFLWFDPKHYGHCYGYHMIPGSEGRKDPFASAYAFMNKAPDELFYDFACQLEEYCLNREPGFFSNTRFWHDLFHGFSHKCPFNFKSQRLFALKDLNTEICEQFNAFIQRIKFSARSMSLSKFNYYLQFMIHCWCENKKLRFQKRCHVAANFLQ